MNVTEFKKLYNFEQRKKRSSSILKKHPTKVPVILQSLPNTANITNIININRPIQNKFLVFRDTTLCNFNYFIRNELKLNTYETLFLFINKKIFSNTAIMETIYNLEKDDDGFLYIYYAKEVTFG